MFRFLTIALLVSSGLMLAFGIPSASIADSATIPAPEVVPQSISSMITSYARLWGVSEIDMRDTINCESGMNPNAVGDHNTSFGIAQIHLPAHPDISKAQALDPNFSINWMAQQFSEGKQNLWSCWKIIHAKP